MIRTVLSDAQWDRIKDLVPGTESDRGVTDRDNHMFVKAVLWVARTGAPWRDLPAEFENWYGIRKLFSSWSKAGVWQSLFKALADDPTSNTSCSTSLSCAPTSTWPTSKVG